MSFIVNNVTDVNNSKNRFRCSERLIVKGGLQAFQAVGGWGPERGRGWEGGGERGRGRGTETLKAGGGSRSSS